MSSFVILVWVLSRGQRRYKTQRPHLALYTSSSFLLHWPLISLSGWHLRCSWDVHWVKKPTSTLLELFCGSCSPTRSLLILMTTMRDLLMLCAYNKVGHASWHVIVSSPYLLRTPATYKKPASFHPDAHCEHVVSQYGNSCDTTSNFIDPDDRYSMRRLIPMIEDAMVDASVSCPVTADVWKKNFRGKVNTI